MKKQVVLMMVLVMLASSFGMERIALAAKIEITDSLTTSVNNLANKAGGAMKTKLPKQFSNLSVLQKDDASWQSKTSKLHYDNEARLTAARKKIKDIDADKIKKLDDQVQAAKTKYQPLFNSYTSVNKQATAAKKLKDKTLYKLLQAQATGLKTASTLAKQDIKNKEALLKAAKTERKRKQDEVRKILNETDTLKIKIKSEKSSISSSNKLISTEWSNFKNAVKKADAERSSDKLARLHTLSSQVITHRKNIYQFEQKITAVLIKAENKLK